MGVGAGAMAFHASSGEHRHWGRKLDYWVSMPQLQRDYLMVVLEGYITSTFLDCVVVHCR